VRLLREAAARLRAAGVPSPDHDAAELVAHVLGVPRSVLTQAVVETAESSDPAAVQRIAELVARRADREPLQHLTGVAYFRHVRLAVGPGVFVPRPETEVMTGWVVEQARARVAAGRPTTVVDLCAGSGAVALSVAHEVPGATVRAVELDERAFEWARRNVSTSPDADRVELRLGDMADAFPELDGTVDVVVSNPPYIPLAAYESVTPEVRDHDPALALWSGEDGLDATRVAAGTAARLLAPGGVVAVEHAEVQAATAPRVFVGDKRWREVRDHVDLAGRPRFVTAVRA
jgi:release factor glutamine methyltransferase